MPHSAQLQAILHTLNNLSGITSHYQSRLYRHLLYPKHNNDHQYAKGSSTFYLWVFDDWLI